MIQGIRRRFIRIAVTVLSIAMILLAGIINVVNYVSVRSELLKTLENLSFREMDVQPGRKSPSRRTHWMRHGILLPSETKRVRSFCWAGPGFRAAHRMN